MVTQDNIQQQSQYLAKTYLSLPAQVMICHVSDHATLEIASNYFFCKLSDGSFCHKYIGVDAEWKTTMHTKTKRLREGDSINEDDIIDVVESKSGGTDGGASILQVELVTHEY